MPDDDLLQPSQSTMLAERAVRPLARRYLAAFASVAALLIVDQTILQPLLVQLNFSAPAINLAGRQRMLSQKITKDALALQIATDEDLSARKVALRQSLDQWLTAHHALLNGDARSGIQPVDFPVAEKIRNVEPALVAIRESAESLLSVNARDKKMAARILALEETYLSGMEAAVRMLEARARRQVAWLRVCGLAAVSAIVCLLVGVYFIVLRPATRLIRGQIEQLAISDARHRELARLLGHARDTLELRVAERTSALQAANEALEREMTERQAVELRMRSLSADLAHASRVTALGQLATGLAHEINQPLATIANCAGTLELGLDRVCLGESEPRELVKRINQAALRAGGIVRRMRNFVRRGEAQRAPVDVNALVQEVLELCGPELRAAEIKVTLYLAPQPAFVSGDPVQLQQVFVNLIQNAKQAMENAPAAQESVLTLDVQVKESEVTVLVRDNGPGLPADLVVDDLQPFTSSKPDGLGLGLAISREIVERHQGRLAGWNHPDGGAQFTFQLPRLLAHETAEGRHVDCLCG